MATLTEIVVPRRGSRRRTLVLDGDPWRDVAADVLAKAGIALGDRIDIPALEAALPEIEEACARDRALRLLTFKDRSTAELAQRLLEDGYPPAAVDAVSERLTALGLLDDIRFAHSYARTLTASRHLGRSGAARELTSRGIDPELAGEALDGALPPEDELTAAHVVARAFAARPGASFDKVAARLLRRGYSARVAYQAAREAVSDEAADPGSGLDLEDG